MRVGSTAKVVHLMDSIILDEKKCYYFELFGSFYRAKK